MHCCISGWGASHENRALLFQKPSALPSEPPVCWPAQQDAWVLPIPVLQASDGDRVHDPQLHSFLCTQYLIKKKKITKIMFSILSRIHDGSRHARPPLPCGARQLEDIALGHWLARSTVGPAMPAGLHCPFTHLCRCLNSWPQIY